MAEGHAVARWAKALRILIGEPLTAVEGTQRWQNHARQLVGKQITAVDTHGKHLLLRSSGEFTIHCHAMQYGRGRSGSQGRSYGKKLATSVSGYALLGMRRCFFMGRSSSFSPTTS